MYEKEWTIGSLYQIQVREDFRNAIPEKYTYYYYNGIKHSTYSCSYHEFIPQLKSYQTKTYTLRLFVNDHQMDYEYDDEKSTANYQFYTDCFIDHRGLINMPNITDEDLYGYDTLHFNVCDTMSG